MSAVHEPTAAPPEPATHEARVASDSELAGLRHELREQGRSIRSSQQAFAIFAVMAFVIATSTLLAVAFKLQRDPKIVTARAATPAAATATSTPLPRNVDVTLAQFAVAPSTAAGSAGKITFRVHNAGTITHEFVVIKTPTLAADLPVTAGRASEAGNAGETGDLKPGVTKSVAINLQPGHYALICNLPGHFLAGQHTDFTVK
jgi:uncharacterized cupredoxin-like copper-binding protein